MDFQPDAQSIAVRVVLVHDDLDLVIGQLGLQVLGGGDTDVVPKGSRLALELLRG